MGWCSEAPKAGIIVRVQPATTKGGPRIKRLVPTLSYIVLFSFVVLFQFLSVGGFPLEVTGLVVPTTALPRALFSATLPTITLAASAFLLFVRIILILLLVRRFW